jgi:hypothetical protein
MRPRAVRRTLVTRFSVQVRSTWAKSWEIWFQLAGARVAVPDPFDFAQGRLRAEAVALVGILARMGEAGRRRGAVPEWGAPWLAAEPGRGKPGWFGAGNEGRPG